MWMAAFCELYKEMCQKQNGREVFSLKAAEIFQWEEKTQTCLEDWYIEQYVLKQNNFVIFN